MIHWQYHEFYGINNDHAKIQAWLNKVQAQAFVTLPGNAGLTVFALTQVEPTTFDETIANHRANPLPAILPSQESFDAVLDRLQHQRKEPHY